MFPADQSPPPLNAYQRERAGRRELDGSLRRRTPHATATRVLLAINVSIYIAMVVDAGRIATFRSDLLVRWGAMFAPNVAAGEWWRLFTAMFLHIHALHVAFNMIALAMVGGTVERLVGTRAFLVFYVAAGLVGSAFSLRAHPLSVAAGASGAILGLYGVLVAMMFERAPASSISGDIPPVPRSQLHVHLRSSVWVIATTLFVGWLDPRADNAAHFGGFLAGCLFGWAGGRQIESRLPTLRVSAAAALIAVGCCAGSLSARRAHPVTDIWPAYHGVFTLDSRALEQYSRLVKANADPETVVRAIEGDIVPAFSRERTKLESIGSTAERQDAVLADLRRYVALREACWRQRAAVLRGRDTAASQQLDVADREADVVMRRLLAVH